VSFIGFHVRVRELRVYVCMSSCGIYHVYVQYVLYSVCTVYKTVIRTVGCVASGTNPTGPIYQRQSSKLLRHTLLRSHLHAFTLHCSSLPPCELWSDCINQFDPWAHPGLCLLPRWARQSSFYLLPQVDRMAIKSHARHATDSGEPTFLGETRPMSATRATS
jgi:hypothetical protein